MMDWNKIASLGLMTPEAISKAKSDAATDMLFRLGGALSAAGAPSRNPGGAPLNLAPVFANYQNAMANSVKQGLMLKQLEIQEKERKRKEAERDVWKNAIAPTSVTESGTGQTAEVPSALMSSLSKVLPSNLLRTVVDSGGGPQLGTALLTAAMKPKEYGHVTRGDGTVALYDKRTGKFMKQAPGVSGTPSAFRGTGMTAQSGNILMAVGPKIEDGTATSEEIRKYNFAYNHLSRDRSETRVDPATNESYSVNIPAIKLDAFPPPPPIATRQSQPAPNAIANETGRSLPAKPSGEETKSAAFYDRLAHANPTLERLESDPLNTPFLNQGQILAGAFGGEWMKRLTMSKEQALYYAAAQDWIRAKLRLDSGAAIPEHEMKDEYETHFPQPNDTEDVIKFKQSARRRITDQMKRSAGSAFVYQKALIERGLVKPREKSASPNAGSNVLLNDKTINVETHNQWNIGDIIEVNGERYKFLGGDHSNKDHWKLQ